MTHNEPDPRAQLSVDWSRFRHSILEDPALGFQLDFTRIQIPDQFLLQMQDMWQQTLEEMQQLEGGAIANSDEGRQVGHYWLRDPDLAPEPGIAADIRTTTGQIETFASRIHAGEIRAPSGPFRRFILIGIGGSALGPQFLADALSPLNAPASSL